MKQLEKIHAVSFIKRGFDVAKSVAISNDEEGVRFRLGAAIFHLQRLIAVGRNRLKSNPFQKKFGKNSDCIFFHAETEAIYNALKEYGMEEFTRMKKTMFIYRTKKHINNPRKIVSGMSRPCNGCLRAICKFEFRYVYYSMDGDLQNPNYDFLDFPFAILESGD